jgi:hypothetical protein
MFMITGGWRSQNGSRCGQSYLLDIIFIKKIFIFLSAIIEHDEYSRPYGSLEALTASHKKQLEWIPTLKFQYNLNVNR